MPTYTFNTTIGAGYDPATGKAVPATHMTRTFNNTMALKQGDVAVDGVLFAAAQVSSSDVNKLDDYEEGSWTPTITSAGGGAPTYTTQVAAYTKIGRLVHVHGVVQMATKNTLGVGAVSIGNLPFTSQNTANLFSAATIGQVDNMTTTVVSMSGTIAANTTAIALNHRTAAAGSSTATLVADISATVLLVFSATYVTAT